MPRAEALHHPACRNGGIGNAEIDVQPGDVIPLPRQFQHERQRVLAAREGDKHPLLTGEKTMAFNAALHLPGEKFAEARRAKGGMVAWQSDDSRRLAAFAFHRVSLR